MADERPVETVIGGVLALLLGLWSLIASLGLLGLGSAASAIGNAAGSSEAATGGAIIMLFGLVALIVGVGYLITMYGLFAGPSWAWPVGMGVVTLDILNGLLGAVIPVHPAGLGLVAVVILAFKLVIAYAIFSNVDWFGWTGAGADLAV